MRLSTATIGLALSPAAALADGTMPQMDFHNPLTAAQVGWMVVILVVLYLLLARWGLPEMGRVLEGRAATIAADLAAARAAKAQADRTVVELNDMMRAARIKAQAEVAEMVASAQARAAANAAILAARLDRNLAESEERIAQARAAALAALKPVAEEAASTIILKLTGREPGKASVSARVDDAMAARKVG